MEKREEEDVSSYWMTTRKGESTKRVKQSRYRPGVAQRVPES